MNNKLSIFLISLTILLLSNTLHAACDYSFSVSYGEPNQNISDAETIYLPITINRNSTKKSCKNHVTVSTFNQPELVFSSSTDSFNANLLRKNRRPWDESIENGSKTWIVKNVSTPKTFYAALEVSNQTIAGTYTALLDFKMIVDGVEEASQSLLVSYYIPAILSATIQDYDASLIQGDAGSYQIELGTLIKDMSTRWNVVVESNAHFSMSIDSNNGGLKHSSSNDVVTYTLDVDGGTFNSSNMSYQHIFTIQTPEAESIIPIILTIGDVDLKMAGRYEDTFTITIMAN